MVLASAAVANAVPSLRARCGQAPCQHGQGKRRAKSTLTGTLRGEGLTDTLRGAYRSDKRKGA